MTEMVYTIDHEAIAASEALLDQARQAADAAAAALEETEKEAEEVRGSVSSAKPPTATRLSRVDSEIELARGRAQRAQAEASRAERSLLHEVPLADAVADVLAQAFPFVSTIVVGADEHRPPMDLDHGPTAVVAQPRPAYHDEQTGAISSNRWADETSIVTVRFHRGPGFAALDAGRLFATAQRTGTTFLKLGHKREVIEDAWYLEQELSTVESDGGAVDTLRVALDTYPPIPRVTHGGQPAAAAWLEDVALEGERPTQQRRGPWAARVSAARSGAGHVSSTSTGDGVRTTQVRGNVTLQNVGSATPADVLGYVSRAAEAARVRPVAGLGRASKILTSLDPRSPGTAGVSVDVVATFVAADLAA